LALAAETGFCNFKEQVPIKFKKNKNQQLSAKERPLINNFLPLLFADFFVNATKFRFS
jgi:hypothetical protein